MYHLLIQSAVLIIVCGRSSVVERNLAKVDVARSNRVARSLVLKLVNLIAPIV